MYSGAGTDVLVLPDQTASSWTGGHDFTHFDVDRRLLDPFKVHSDNTTL